MVGIIKLKSTSLVNQRNTGNKVLSLIKSVGNDTATSEWKKFKDDPKAWLTAAGYEYDGPGAGPNGELPTGLNIVPVYDTETTMHVRIPWKGHVDPAPTDVQNEPAYGPPGNRFPVLIARYFIRQCR